MSVIDFDLKHRISRLQFSTRRFSCVNSVEFRLEMTVDDRHKANNRESVGS
jgi:hypothetical protein